MIITTSWDDGHPSDRRLADLLAKYGVAGTFYVPTSHSEGHEVIESAAVREIATQFEIGGHSEDHVELISLKREEIVRQISQNKMWLEDCIGQTVTGFCYTYGTHSPALKRTLRECGFDYARTTKNLSADVGTDLFGMPTTLQFYPHDKSVYVRNLFRYAPDANRLRLFRAAYSGENLLDRAQRMAEICAARNGVFHLWGHSWDLDRLALWDDLEQTLRALSAFPGAKFLTNGQVMGSQPTRLDGVRQDTRGNFAFPTEAEQIKTAVSQRR